MTRWIKQLDNILRGDATKLSAIQNGRIEIPIGGLSIITIALAVIYGLCMGSFAVIRTAWGEGVTNDALMQLLASAVKLPLLFFLTLVVTFPSLYVFNALVGSRLSMLAVLRLLVAMLGVLLAVLASLGPIVVFFTVSTDSYPFMKLLNVVAAAIAGFLGLAFLLRTLHRLVMAQDLLDHPPAPTPGTPPTEPVAPEDDESRLAKSALDRIESPTGRKATAVFKVWVLVFGLVGAQMSWVLRPFIGSPDMPFSWFRERESNFFFDVLHAIGKLLGV